MAEQVNINDKDIDILDRTLDIVLNAVENKPKDDEKLQICVRAFVHDVAIKAIKVKHGVPGQYDKQVLEEQIYPNFPKLRELFMRLGE